MLRTFLSAAALLGNVAASPASPIAPRTCVNETAQDSGIVPCEALRNAGLGHRLLFPTDEGYEPQIETYWAMDTRLRPYCFVLPHSTEEVATALTALVGANSGAGDWHIALRSGGHSWPGSNGIDKGVTIDLQMMNSSTYDPETNLAMIQPGGHWDNVYADLDEQGVVVAGGRDGNVGVGGFVLGGGISFFSGRVGWGCDSVVNFEIVLANGTVINANSSANADLWRALKGGSSNFGIVTRYDMEAMPTRELFSEALVLSSNYTDAVVQAVSSFADHDQSFGDDALVTYFSHDTTVLPGIHVNVIHVNIQGNTNTTTAFNSLKKLPTVSSGGGLRSMAQSAAASQVEGGQRFGRSTLLFHNDPRIVRRCTEAHERFVATLERSIDPERFRTIIFLQPLPSWWAELSQQRGGNVLGLEPTQHNAVMFTGFVAVDDAAELALAEAEMMRMTAEIKQYSEELQGDMDFVFLNYAGPAQDPLGSYGPANVQFIKDVADAYDPAQVMQTRIPGGFKISRVE